MRGNHWHRGVRQSGMTGLRRITPTVLLFCVLSACAGITGTTAGGACTSHYRVVASAPTWHALRDAMGAYQERGDVASLRTQARGYDVGVGDQEAVRVVDLLNRRGRRLVQVEVWRTDRGGWRAGVWGQCID